MQGTWATPVDLRPVVIIGQIVMKEGAEYLLPFQSYAKLLMTKIHPDKHHGYPNIQKINASVTSIVNELFKFKPDYSEKRHQIHNLHFFTWKPDKREHEEIFYKLVFNNPFDLSSGKSSLNLFKTAQIPVNFSVLDCLTDQNEIVEPVSKLNNTFSKDINEGIKQSCFDLDQVITEHDIREIRYFFRIRPYIQFHNSLSDELSKILRIGTFLMHSIQGLEVRMGSRMPLIIISNTYTTPEFINGTIHLPLSSSFLGLAIYWTCSRSEQFTTMGNRNFNLVGKKIIGIGRNYLDHAKEMSSPIPKEPMFFLKPTSSYVLEPNPIKIPENLKVDHEVELGVVIGRAGSNIKEENAFKHVAGYALALDLTARDLQSEAKKSGLPWSHAKGFDTFCPISAYIPASSLTNPSGVDIWCKVNEEIRQKGNTRDMIFPIPRIISYLSSIMRLEPGDFILTGTPAGVGPIKIGDTITAGLGHDYMTMRFKVVKRPEVLNKF